MRRVDVSVAAIPWVPEGAKAGGAKVGRFVLVGRGGSGGACVGAGDKGFCLIADWE